MKAYLKPLDTFRSKWFNGLVLVDRIDGNKLHVIIDPEQPKRSLWEEIWDLEHVAWGFKRGDYFELKRS